MKRIVLVLVGAVAVTTLLTGCIQWFLPPTIESTSQPTNEEVAARATTPAATLATLDAITEARTRIEGNVAPALALEAMLITAVRDTAASR